ncbi:MAG: hypothetical protein ACYC6Y_14145 [Thermoguttaceae bacterium]
MSATSRIALPLLLVLLIATLPAARGADPPRLLYLGGQSQAVQPLPKAPVYVRKGTWHESMAASLAATFGSAAEPDRARQPGRFHPAIVRLAADQRPVQLELCLEGVERLCFATLGRLPEDGAAFFLRPTLFDRQGRSVELTLDSPMLVGRPAKAGAKPVELTIDGAVCRGLQLMPGEVVFRLDGQYERLEVSVASPAQAGLPPYAAVDCRPLFGRATECRQVREALWELVARDFRDRQSQIEMEMEQRDGIWND